MDRRVNPNRNSRNDVSYSRVDQNINRYSVLDTILQRTKLFDQVVLECLQLRRLLIMLATLQFGNQVSQ
jgi:hypothetical protein